MQNNGAVFISRFAPLGLYKRISIDEQSVVESMEGKNDDQPVVTFKYNGNKTCKLRLMQYSVEGQNFLRNMLKLKD